MFALGVLTSTIASAADPKITARSGLVMDARTGEVLWSKNPDQRRAPASTTKIVTTMLALESGRLDESFTVSARAQKQVPSKLYLHKGQRVTLRDLTYALMLKSANDGAVVVAEGLGGSVESFARKMEARAKKAGATRTTFRNPSGLTHAQHLSTARDLGKIMRAALDVPGFRRVAGTQARKIRVRGSKVRSVTLNNKNRLVRGYFASVIGKTGYTRAAGRCFAGAATYEGREVIVVIMGSRDLWGDTKALVEWAHRGDGRGKLPRVQVASAKRAAKPAAKKASPAPKAAPSAAKPTVKKAAVVAPKKSPAKASVAPPKKAPEPPTRIAAAKVEPKRAVPPPPRPAARASEPRPRSAALKEAPAPRVRSAALASGSPTRAAAYRPPVKSAAPPPKPQRVAMLARETPAYVRAFQPRGNVRRGCTGYGCDRGARYWPSR